jgi:DNA modification methylase
LAVLTVARFGTSGFGRSDLHIAEANAPSMAIEPDFSSQDHCDRPSIGNGEIMTHISYHDRAIATLKVNDRNARTHSKKQIRQIANSMKEFGVISAVVIDEKDALIAGHGRLEAAKLLRLQTIPTFKVCGLSDAQKRLLMLADNKIASNAGWDREKLAGELAGLMELDVDLDLTGFEPVEIDQLCEDFSEDSHDPADDVPETQDEPVSVAGDLWMLGRHRLLCGDARSSEDMALLMGTDRAAMAFLDPPYNVRVAGIVGRGSVKHREFAMASGEMTRREFREFLATSLQTGADFSSNGAVHYVCMDWRHIEDLMAVGRSVYGDTLNLIAWVKNNAGQGSFYRSQHELIAVFRVGEDRHLNNVVLGAHGRNRTNVWHYAGVNSFGKERMAELTSHPTVKPVAMIADAIRDCTRKASIVLDTFAGSGSTLLACERIGRKGRAIEISPGFVDVAIRRWQAFTGRDAVHAVSGKTFDETKTSKEVA